MSLLSHKHGSSPKIELKSKECIDLVLQPLKYHVTIKVNGSLTSEDIFRTVVSWQSTIILFTLFQNSIKMLLVKHLYDIISSCLLYTSPSPRDGLLSRMPSSA